MKTNVLVLFLLGWAGMVFGQENEIKKDGNYYFNHISLNDLKSFTNESKTEKSLDIQVIKELFAGTKYKITVNKIDGKIVYFRFWKFSDDTINKIINNPAGVKSDARAEYSLSLDDFKNNTKPLFNRIDWRVGIYTVPIKIRLKEFSFDGNVNLGTSLGAKIRFNREIEHGFALEPILGVGLASIKLDESNSMAVNSTNVSAFTINTGVLIHITNGINVGLTYGFDHISRKDQNNYNWTYNCKGWFGVGINVTFNNQTDNKGGGTGK